jgi:hypothetical protein
VSTCLIIMACYFIIDRLITIAWVGRKLEITGGFAVLAVITGTFFVVVCLNAAFGGVTP